MKILGVFLLAIICPLHASIATKLVKDFDFGFYHPEKFKLKDLVFEIRNPDIVKQLKNRVVFKDIKEVYFKVYWLEGKKIEVEVYGLPKGFKELKQSLIESIRPRIDFIVPASLEDKLEGYTLKIDRKEKNKTVILAEDESHLKEINQIYLSFDRSGKLIKMTRYRPTGIENSSLTMTKKDECQRKWVLDEISIKATKGLQTIETNSKLTYEKVNGFCVPVKIESSTKQGLVQPVSSKNETYNREFVSKLEFTGYEINAGKAANFFRKNK